ncbi:DNA glycosylase AlkZ-like family protein [Actinomycetospora flava]|uniref:Crosslink repair DNA glycosylase YcaQ family protein n=1 Tax=Actinomycetospora flava TaxID=3129232 RepID=A0ABU8LYN5_9PSEU
MAGWSVREVGNGVDRAAVVAHRLAVQHLDRRLPASRWREAVACGLQDSAPRSAVLALHARVSGVAPDAWEHPDLAQVWGPRGAVYVVLAADVAAFTLGLMPRDEGVRDAAEETADVLGTALGPDRVRKREVLEIVDGRLDRLMAAAVTGRVRLRWDGRDTLVWIVPAPAVDPETARADLLRRFLDALGPSTPAGFARWSGLRPAEVRTTWEAVAGPEPASAAAPARGARLLPPGDPFLLAPDRELLVPDADRRRAVWPLGVAQPGALLADGEIVATWRRRGHRVEITAFDDLPDDVRSAAEQEAAGFPLGLDPEVGVTWARDGVGGSGARGLGDGRRRR